jgi:hypothetical protein
LSNTIVRTGDTVARHHVDSWPDIPWNPQALHPAGLIAAFAR